MNLVPAPVRPLDRDARRDFDALVERALVAAAEDRDQAAWGLGAEARLLYRDSRRCLDHHIEAPADQLQAFDTYLGQAIDAALAGHFDKAEGKAQSAKALFRATSCSACGPRPHTTGRPYSGLPT